MKGKEVGVWMDEREPSARVSRQRRGLTEKAPALAEAQRNVRRTVAAVNPPRHERIHDMDTRGKPTPAEVRMAAAVAEAYRRWVAEGRPARKEAGR